MRVMIWNKLWVTMGKDDSYKHCSFILFYEITLKVSVEEQGAILPPNPARVLLRQRKGRQQPNLW